MNTRFHHPFRRRLLSIAFVATWVVSFHSASAQPVPGAQLWLDANDLSTFTTNANGTVTNWANKGTSGGVAYQSFEPDQPELVSGAMNGKPAIRFQPDEFGFARYLTGSYTNQSATMTLYLVAEWKEDVLNRGPLSLITAPGDVDWDSPARLALLRDDTTKIDAWRGLFDSGQYMRTMPVTADTPYLIEIRYGGTFATAEITVTKVGQTSNSGTDRLNWGGGSAPFDVNHFVIGGRSEGTIMGWNGHIAELVIYNHDLTAEQRAAMQTYLLAKWLGIVGPPELTIHLSGGSQVRLSWPSDAAGFNVERTSSLPGGWTAAGLTVTVEGDENVAYDSISGARYYRLVK
jgi:hypothetical protein